MGDQIRSGVINSIIKPFGFVKLDFVTPTVIEQLIILKKIISYSLKQKLFEYELVDMLLVICLLLKNIFKRNTSIYNPNYHCLHVAVRYISIDLNICYHSMGIVHVDILCLSSYLYSLFFLVSSKIIQLNEISMQLY